MLRDKSLTSLRAIAQGMGVADIFTKDDAALRQAIELKQQELQPAPVITVPQPPYDARLMTKPPSKRANREEIEEVLAPHIALGLKLSFTEEQWMMSCGKKNDQGTIRMPLRHVLNCAKEVMR